MLAFVCAFFRIVRNYSQLGDLGSGAGKGGGGGGSIREAGGAFGKLEAAREEEYFYRKVCNILSILSLLHTYILQLHFYVQTCNYSLPDLFQQRKYYCRYEVIIIAQLFIFVFTFFYFSDCFDR